MWEREFRVLVHEQIKDQVTSNTSDPRFMLMWAKRPHGFVQSETTKLLEGAWVLFPAWQASYDLAHPKSTIERTWHGLSAGKKHDLARNFKNFFYKKRGLHAR